MGSKNPHNEYRMLHNGQDIILDTTDLEKDLGVWIDPSLKFSKHTELQVNEANSIFGLIRRSYTHTLMKPA